MSFLGDAWNGVKHVAGNVGKAVVKGVQDTGHEIGRAQNKDWVKALEAGALAATGVGAPSAAAILGGGSLLGGAIAPHGTLGKAAGQGLKGAAIGGTAGLLGHLGSAGSALEHLPGVSQVGGALGDIPGVGAAGGYLKNVLGQAVGGGEGGGLNPLTIGLAGLQTANAASLGKQANDFSDKAWNLANDSYTSRLGLRDAGMQHLLTPETRDLSRLTGIASTNPYTQPRQASGLMPPANPVQPPTVPLAAGGL